MKIQFLLHADFEKPGAIHKWAEEKECSVEFVSPYKGDSLPSFFDMDLLILMGGPQSPLRLESSPYLSDEIHYIQKVLSQNKTVLGFCLGAQLIGEAFGAKTEKSPYKEIGVFPVELTQEGKKDPIFSSVEEEFLVMHWHYDMPGVASDSKVLAKSLGCPRQVVRYSQKAYGFQCHPEMMRENLNEMLVHCRKDLKPDLFVHTEEQLLAQDFESNNRLIYQILDELTC